MSLDRAHASFDGHSLEELFVIEDVRRPVLGSASATTQAVGLADGGVFLATRYEVPEIKVSLAQAWRDPRDARDALRRLAAWLHVDSPRPLEFGDESGAYYMALPSGALDASRVGVSAERIEVTFAVPDALLRSGITRSVTSADGLAEFEVGGTAPTPPLITATAAQGSPVTFELDGEHRLSVQVGSTARALRVDCDGRLVAVGGTETMITLDSDWLDLAPGSHAIEMTSGSGEFAVTWNDRWYA